jgi:NADH:ubiquinone oxidoreductase subunit K
MNDLNIYLTVGAILFSLGLYGVITRRNGVAVLMGVELILNSTNVTLSLLPALEG